MSESIKLTQKQVDYILEMFDRYGYIKDPYDNIAGKIILEKVLNKCLHVTSDKEG